MTQALFTIATILLATNCEGLFFNDGHGEFEDPQVNFETDSTLPRFVFSRDQMRVLRTWLNKPEIAQILDQE